MRRSARTDDSRAADATSEESLRAELAARDVALAAAGERIQALEGTLWLLEAADRGVFNPQPPDRIWNQAREVLRGEPPRDADGVLTPQAVFEPDR